MRHEPLNPAKTKGTPSTRHVRSAPDTVIQQGDAGLLLDVLRRLAACPPEEAPEEDRRGLFLASGDVLGGRGGPEASGAVGGPEEAKGTQERACCDAAVGLPSQRVGLEENLPQTPYAAGWSPSSHWWLQHE
jgi:hypothetical protein